MDFVMMKNQHTINDISQLLKTGIEMAIKKQFEQSTSILKKVQQQALKTKQYNNYTLAAAHLGGLYFVTGKMENGIEIMQNTVAQFQPMLPESDVGLIICQQNLFIIDAQRYGDFGKGLSLISQLYKSLLLNKNSLRKEIEKGRLQILLSTCYLHTHQPYESLLAIAEALKILELIKIDDIEVSELLVNAYYIQGTVYYKIGDYYECLKHMHKAEYVNNNKLKVDNINSATMYSVTASIYFKLSNFKLSKIYYKKAIDLIKSIGYTDVGFGNIYVDLGFIFYTQNDKKNAFKNIQHVLKIMNQNYEHHPDNGYAFDMLATIHNFENNVDDCIENRLKAIKLYKKNTTTQLKYIVTSIKLINDYINFNQLNKAKQYIIDIELTLKQYFDYSANDHDKAKVDFQYYIYWLSFYVTKCHWLFMVYKSNPNLNSLKHTYNTVLISIEVYELVRNNIKNVQTLYAIAEDTQRLFSIAVEASHQLYLQTGADNLLGGCFRFSEMNKSFRLLMQMQHNWANTQLPDQLSKKERDLNFAIHRLENTIMKELKESKPDTNKIQIWQYENDKLNKERAVLIEQISNTQPNYFNWKYQTKTISITNLQKVLKANELFIEYFSTKQHIYIFAITQKKVALVQQKINGDLKKQVVAFNQLLQGSLIYKIAQAGKVLYDILIKPIEHLTQEAKSLKIIPDNHLAQLPFEALISKKPETLTPQQLPYLICSQRITYHYSAGLYYYSKTKASNQKNYTKQFGGFAPVYKSKQIEQQNVLKQELALRVSKNNDELNELVYSETEVQSVANLFKKNEAEVFLHEKATVKNFVQKAADYKYLLVAAHHIYNNLLPENSGILFAPVNVNSNTKTLDNHTHSYLNNHTFIDAITSQQMLFEADAYGLQINADLVILSCCETGLGKVVTGEGIMGINRGFLFAGAKNIISTLFKVYDKQSSKFSFYLFDNIVTQKQSYDEAIRNAKLSMIDDELTLPKDWAGYVLMGN